MPAQITMPQQSDTMTEGTVVKWLKKEGDKVKANEIIDVRTLRPLDEQTIIHSVKKTNRLLIVDEDWPYCGMGAGILAQLNEKVFDDLDAPIARVCSEDVPVPFNHYLEMAMQPSVERVIEKVKDICYR